MLIVKESCFEQRKTKCQLRTQNWLQNRIKDESRRLFLLLGKLVYVEMTYFLVARCADAHNIPNKHQNKIESVPLFVYFVTTSHILVV